MLSLIISGFPFTFLLTLSYLTGIDPSLEQAASTLGARARARFVHILLPLLAQGLAINLCLSFVQTFSVFPSAVLLGAPAGATRVISIAAYQAAYEQYDSSMASAIAMIMGFCQLCRRRADPRRAALCLSRLSRRRQRLTAMGPEKSVSERLWAIAIWALVIFFVVNVIAMIAAVAVNSFGNRWFNSWLPAGFTTRWYRSAWDEFQLHDVLIVTFEVVGAVVLLRRPARRAGGLRAGAAQFSRQAVRHSAVSAADADPADHLRHSAGDGALPGRISAATCRASSSPTWCRRCPSSCW